MNYHSEDATALLGMGGFLVLSQTEEDGEVWILLETSADEASCPSFEVKALGMVEAKSR
ncbi:MAG: hypothetical protein M1131_05645 [Actinobacteria bacterium]|nr:hypothetical protein [Actinomycetota bacterium]